MVFCILYILYDVDSVIKVNNNEILMLFDDFFDVVFILGLLEIFVGIVSYDMLVFFLFKRNMFEDCRILLVEDLGIERFKGLC